MLFRRHSVHALLLTPLVVFATVRVASACARSEWVYDQAQLPACVTLMPSGTYSFDVYNDCAEPLTLAASSCPTCTLPDSIPAEDVGELDFGAYPDPEGTSIDVDWETGETSGTVAFSFDINRCPQTRALGDRCAATPGSSGSAPCALVILMAFAVRLRTRRARC